MSSSMCSFSMMCPSDTDSSLDSISNAGKIVAIVIGSVLGLAVLICITVIIYLACCKRKPKVQVWAHPCSQPQSYGQSMAMFPYTNYPQGPIQMPQTYPSRVIEEPPPAYEEIVTMEEPNRRF